MRAGHVDLREERMCSTCRELRSGLRGGAPIQKTLGVPPEIPVTLLSGNARFLVLESSRGLPLQVTVFTDEGEEIAREGLDGGQTLSLPPCSSKGLSSLVLEASHSLQGPVVLLRPLVWARRVPGSISACQDVIYSICQDVVLFSYGGSLQDRWSNNR